MTIFTFEQNNKNEQMYSVDELVAKKSVDLPPPNLNQRISIQVISYKEMSEQTPISNEIGHLVLFLESVVSTTNNLDPELLNEIEILFNLNNQKGKIPIGNRRALLLLSSVTRFKDLPVEKIVEVMVQDGMLVDSNLQPDYELEVQRLTKQLQQQGVTNLDEISEIVESRLTEMRKNHHQSLVAKERIINLINALRQKVESGLSIGLIDCTDGSYISKYKESDVKIYPNTQAARRLLLSEIAKGRSDQIGGNSLMIPMDNDCLLTEAGMKTWLNSAYKKEAFFSIPEFVADESYGGDSESLTMEAKVFQQFSNFKIIRGFIKAFFNNKRPTFAPFLGACGFSTDTYKTVNGWDLMDESLGEDSRMMTKIYKKVDSWSFYPRPLVQISARIREESWMGNADKWSSRSRDSYLIKVPESESYWQKFDPAQSYVRFDQISVLLFDLIRKRFGQADIDEAHRNAILKHLDFEGDDEIILIRMLNSLLASGLSQEVLFSEGEISNQLHDLFEAISKID